MSHVIRQPRECAGKFIAWLGERVVACAPTIEDLKANLRSMGLDPRLVVIDYVPEEPVLFILGVGG